MYYLKKKEIEMKARFMDRIGYIEDLEVGVVVRGLNLFYQFHLPLVFLGINPLNNLEHCLLETSIPIEEMGFERESDILDTITDVVKRIKKDPLAYYLIEKKRKELQKCWELNE